MLADNRRMPLWQVSSDTSINGYTYTTARGFGHSLLAQIVAGTFKVLRVSASLCSPANYWWAIHSEPNLVSFELEHGVMAERAIYNTKKLAESQRLRKVVRGHHAGLCDLFVPIQARGEFLGSLVSGPFATKRPTGLDVQERWRGLTGRHGHLADPEFAAYLSTSLSTLVLEGAHAALYEELLLQLAQLIAGEGDADALANRADTLRVELQHIRDIDQAWAAVREMVDDRFARAWDSEHRTDPLQRLGLSRVADHALVGLTVSRARGFDPVDEAVRREAFQRAAVGLAQSVGNVIAGQVGDNGVVFLLVMTGGIQRRKQKVLDLAERATALARRFDLAVHYGVSAADRSAPISRGYHAALGAAEAALLQGVRMISVEPGGSRQLHSLRQMRRALARVSDDRAEILTARFERYMDAVALERGYRVDTARGYLESGFERLAEALLTTGRLDEKTYVVLCEGLDHAADSARTTGDLLAAYRRAAADLAEAMNNPLTASHDRGLESAVDYINQHYTEPLAVARVARVAGFTPNYFSKLFKARERMAFAAYVSLLRVERAKHLLSSTKLDATRIAALCGFGSSQYFSRVFRHTTGKAPLEYRANPGKIRRRVQNAKNKKTHIN